MVPSITLVIPPGNFSIFFLKVPKALFFAIFFNLTSSILFAALRSLSTLLSKFFNSMLDDARLTSFFQNALFKSEC